MINKAFYLSELSELREIAKKYNAMDNILKKIDQCTSDINKFTLKVLFVGGFNAGKSALINAVLNRELLIENQQPETAIACEIIFESSVPVT